MLHSIYDLTTFCRKTSGDVPPKLVGASTTVVGRKMYLFVSTHLQLSMLRPDAFLPREAAWCLKGE